MSSAQSHTQEVEFSDADTHRPEGIHHLKERDSETSPSFVQFYDLVLGNEERPSGTTKHITATFTYNEW